MSLFTDRNIVIALVLLQVAVCLPFINSFPIALDEPFSIFWAQQELGEMLPEINKGNNSPLHFIFLNGWINLFGISPISVRSLSLLFSLLTIPVLYFLGKKILTREFTIFFVLIFIFSRFNHYHAMEARMYSLLVLLFSCIIFFTYSVIFESKRNIILLSVFNALIFYTHYLGLIVVMIEFAIVVFFFKKLSRQKRFDQLKILGLSAILMIPGLLIFVQRFTAQSTEGSWVAEPQYSEIYGNIIRFFNNTFTFLFLISILIVAFILVHRKSIGETIKNIFDKKSIFIFSFFLVPYLGMFVFSKLFEPIFLDRYLLFTTIPLYLSLAIITQRILTIKAKNWLIAAMVIPLIVSFKISPSNDREPNLIAEEVKSLQAKNCLIAIAPPYFDLTFIYHFNLDIFKSYNEFTSKMNSQNIYGIYSFEDIKRINEFDQVIFVDDNSSIVYPENNIMQNLNKWGDLKSEKKFKGGTTVYSFEKISQ